MLASQIKPKKVEIVSKQELMKIWWQSGGSVEIDFNELRKHCACSFCRAKGQLGKPLEATTQVINAVPMGSTGLQLVFSDGHDRGVYPWGYLQAIGDGRGLDYFNELH